MHELVQLEPGMPVVQVDSSWDQKNRVGTGFALFDSEGNLIKAAYTTETAAEPFHAEAISLMRVLEHITIGGGRHKSDQFHGLQITGKSSDRKKN